MPCAPRSATFVEIRIVAPMEVKRSPGVRIRHPGTPLLTPLSTNATCQLEKPENSAPNPLRRHARRWFGRTRHQPVRRAAGLQHVRNVGDSAAPLRRTDAVNKTGA